MSVFVHAQGIKTVHAGGGGKNGKILSTYLLNAPLWVVYLCTLCFVGIYNRFLLYNNCHRN